MNYNISYSKKVAKYLSIITFFLLTFPYYSQTTIDEIPVIKDKSALVFDSLINNLNNTFIDTLKINILNEICWEYAPTNFEKSKKFADSALVFSRKIGWKKGEGFALKNLGEALRYNGMVEESLIMFEAALNIFENLKYDTEIPRVFNHIGLSNRYLSNLQEAYEFHNKALNIYLENGDKEGIVKGYTYLGVLFKKFNDFNKSLNYYKKSLEIAEGMELHPSHASLNNNIGSIYRNLNKYPEALVYFKNAEQIYKKFNNIRGYSILLGNIGNLYLKQKLYNEALIYTEKALYYREKMNDNYGIAYQNANLADIKYNMAISSGSQMLAREKENLYLEAIESLKKAIKIFDELGNKVEQLENIFLLAKTYKANNSYLLAFNALEKAQELEDNLQIQSVNRTITDLEFQQNLSIKEKEIEILNKDYEYQKLIKKIFIGFAFILVIVSLFIFYLYSNKRKYNKILEENIQIRIDAEEALRKNEIELNKHKNNLEYLVAKRTKELEKEIHERKRTEEDLLVAIDRVETANRAKTVFLENMSHELRTPLVGILGYSELLSSEVKTKELSEMADGINRTGNRLLNTLSMVLDLARIESDKFEINIVEVNVENELSQIYNNFKGAVAIKNIDFSIDLDDEARVVNTDEGMFRVIVENLVNNAIKFTKKGKITIESKIIKNGSHRDLLVNVIDTGIGIRENEISEIFKEFKQLSEGTLKDFQGTGLGLSISKKFIENLNGSLTVESEFGIGSRFTIKFPIT
jgi:signal transduction histidine kinase/tetratricopeptide (TPR) repeat protein